MAREIFKNLPDASTPINASKLNGVFNGEESMGSIVVEDITCKNLFNKNKIASGRGISTATGELYVQSGLFTTDYINVTNLNNIAWNGTYTSANKPWGAFYDSNKKYVSGFETTLNVNTKAIPTGVAYVRLTYVDNSNEFLNKLQIEPGTVATNFVEHKEFENNEIYSENEQVIGSWINGKPIYRKVFKNITVTSTGFNFDFSKDWDYLVRYDFKYFANNSTKDEIHRDFYNSSTDFMRTFRRGSSIAIRCGSGLVTDVARIDFIFEYTKTTD